MIMMMTEGAFDDDTPDILRTIQHYYILHATTCILNVESNRIEKPVALFALSIVIVILVVAVELMSLVGVEVFLLTVLFLLFNFASAFFLVFFCWENRGVGA